MTPEDALAVLGGTMVVMVGGGAWYSTMSAVKGPRWSLQRIGSLRFGGWVIGIAGFLLTVLAKPRWLGLSLLYLAVIVFVLGILLGRSLGRLEAVGALDEIGRAGRESVIVRARVGLVVSSLAFAGLAALVNGVLALIMAAIALALLANWIGLRVVSGQTMNDEG